MSNQPFYQCPICKKKSYHSEDIKYKYCGNCHQFEDKSRDKYVTKSSKKRSRDKKRDKNIWQIRAIMAIMARRFYFVSCYFVRIKGKKYRIKAKKAGEGNRTLVASLGVLRCFATSLFYYIYINQYFLRDKYVTN